MNESDIFNDNWNMASGQGSIGDMLSKLKRGAQSTSTEEVLEKFKEVLPTEEQKEAWARIVKVQGMLNSCSTGRDRGTEARSSALVDKLVNMLEETETGRGKLSELTKQVLLTTVYQIARNWDGRGFPENSESMAEEAFMIGYVLVAWAKKVRDEC